MSDALTDEKVTVAIGWHETVHYRKNVQMTRAELEAWNARLDNRRDQKVCDDLADKYTLHSVQPSNWDGIDNIDFFGVEE